MQTSPASYSTGDRSHAVNYGSTPAETSESESRFNKSFFISIPGILKLVSLVSEMKLRKFHDHQ